MKWFKKTYLNWHEYAALEREAQLPDSISKTAQELAQNDWKKEVEK